jgi:transcription termination factor NusB
MAGTLLVSLILGATFIKLHRTEDLRGAAVERPAHPLTDAQAKDQVVDSARQFISAGRFTRATGSYILMACKEDEDPVYQGSLYLNFDLPTIRETPAYFREIVTGVVRDQRMLDPAVHEALTPGWPLQRLDATLIHKDPEMDALGGAVKQRMLPLKSGA